MRPVADLKDTFRIGQEVDVLFRGAKVLDIGGNFLDLDLADGDDLCVIPGNTGVTVRPTVDDSPALASFTTAQGTWALVELHKRPGGDVDAIASHTAPGRRPILHGFRHGVDGWQQLAGEWTDPTVARWDVARATCTQAASRQALFFLDAAMVGRTS